LESWGRQLYLWCPLWYRSSPQERTATAPVLISVAVPNWFDVFERSQRPRTRLAGNLKVALDCQPQQPTGLPSSGRWDYQGVRTADYQQHLQQSYARNEIGWVGSLQSPESAL
jgi:hypothetical protein